MVHQDDHHLNQIIRLTPVICIRTVQFVDVVRLNPSRILFGPDFTNMANVTAVV